MANRSSSAKLILKLAEQIFKADDHRAGQASGRDPPELLVIRNQYIGMSLGGIDDEGIFYAAVGSCVPKVL
jgi:hypothetical protein